MYERPNIQALDAKKTLFVLKDETGNAMGTGSRQSMEVLWFIAEQSKRQLDAARQATATNSKSALSGLFTETAGAISGLITNALINGYAPALGLFRGT